MTIKAVKPRPYWHVDAKWITGIISILVLMTTFSIYLLVEFTTSEEGINILTTTMASAFSYESGGMDEAGDIENMKEKIIESANGEYKPIPGLEITVRMEDIEGKSPREARLWFFRKLAEPLYYQGQQGIIDKMTDAEMKKDLADGIGPLTLLSSDTHSKLNSALIISAVSSLFLVVLLFIFSYGFGRLGTPGFVIFLASTPNLLLLTGLKKLLSAPVTDPANEGIQSIVSRYTQLVSDILPDLVQKAITFYLILCTVGIALMVIGLIGSIIFRRKKKNAELEPAG